MLEFLPLHPEELLLAMPADDPLAERFARSGVDLQRLRDVPFILNQANSFFRSIERELFLQQGITPHVLCEISDLNASLKMVKNHRGCAFIPRSMQRQADGVRCFPLNPPAGFHVVIACHKGAVLSRPVQDLIRVMQDAYNPAQT